MRRCDRAATAAMCLDFEVAHYAPEIPRVHCITREILVPPFVVSLVVFLGISMCAAFLDCPIANWPIRTRGSSNDGPTYFVPKNRTKLTTRGGTSPDGVEIKQRLFLTELKTNSSS